MNKGLIFGIRTLGIKSYKYKCAGRLNQKKNIEQNFDIE